MNTIEIIKKFREDKETQIRFVQENIENISVQLKQLEKTTVDVINNPSSLVKQEREKRKLQRELEDENIILKALYDSKAPVCMEQLEEDIRNLMKPYDNKLKEIIAEAKELRDNYFKKIEELHNAKREGMDYQRELCKNIKYIDADFTSVKEFIDYVYGLPSKDTEVGEYGILKEVW